jgi:hypothetical protein
MSKKSLIVSLGLTLSTMLTTAAHAEPPKNHAVISITDNQDVNHMAVSQKPLCDYSPTTNVEFYIAAIQGLTERSIISPLTEEQMKSIEQYPDGKARILPDRAAAELIPGLESNCISNGLANYLETQDNFNVFRVE